MTVHVRSLVTMRLPPLGRLLLFRWKLFVGLFAVALLAAIGTALLTSLVVGEPASGFGQDDADALAAVLASAAAVCIALALPAAFFIAWRLNRPLRRLLQAMRSVDDGDLTARVPPTRTWDEFELLIDRFNAMLDGLVDRNRLALSLREEEEANYRHTQARAELEREVLERASELATAGQALRSEVAGHNWTLTRLIESDLRYRTLVDQAAVGIMQADREGRVRFVNHQWQVMLGPGPIGDGPEAWLHRVLPEQRDHAIRRCCQAVQSGQSHQEQVSVTFDDGGQRALELLIRPLSDPEGGVSGLLATAVDVTERELAARERERIFAVSLDLICLAGFNGFFKRINQAFERVLGWPSQTLLESPFISFVHPDDVESTGEVLRGLTAGQPVVNFENRYRCADGSFVTLEWSATPIPEENVIYAIARDVTAVRAAERERRELLASQLELNLARDIQSSLLPASPLSLAGLEIAGESRPASGVGGDYYDFIPSGDHRLTLVVADAVGHGIGAALMAAQLRACLWALVESGPMPLPEILRATNRLLVRGTPASKFVTAVVVELDLRTRTFTYASCGHPTAYLARSSGEVTRLPSTSRPLGLFLDSEFTAAPAQRLEIGDTLLIPTDGVLESARSDDEAFGEARLLSFLGVRRGLPASATAAALHGEVEQFAADGSDRDDVTVLVVRAIAPVPEPDGTARIASLAI